MTWFMLGTPPTTPPRRPEARRYRETRETRNRRHAEIPQTASHDAGRRGNPAASRPAARWQSRMSALSAALHDDLAPVADGDPESSDSGVTENTPATPGVGQNATATSPLVTPPMRTGWALGVESWKFHRHFFARTGRPMLPDEYGAILRQIRRGGTAQLLAVAGRGGVYRVRLADGSPAIVRGGKKTLAVMLPADWEPPPSMLVPLVSAQKDATEARAARRPVMALRGSTLSLVSPVAAHALEKRLRSMGIPMQVASL